MYEEEIAEIVGEFRKAGEEINAEMASLDVSALTNSGAQPVLKRVGEILRELLAKVSEMVARLFGKAAAEGVSKARESIGVPGPPEPSRSRDAVVAAATSDMQSDLLAVTQNIDRRTKAAIRRAVADSMRANMSAGINGRRTLNRDTLAGIRKALGSSADTAIIDAAGRRWKPEVYVDMVTRTKAMNTQIDATIDEALARDVQYGVISRHGAKDACARYEGKVVKLTPDAPGDYPYIGALKASGAIFHPNCKHVISPIRNPRGDTK
jgi:hypothetical protein